jgi:hypothetical protein
MEAQTTVSLTLLHPSLTFIPSLTLHPSLTLFQLPMDAISVVLGALPLVPDAAEEGKEDDEKGRQPLGQDLEGAYEPLQRERLAIREWGMDDSWRRVRWVHGITS